MFLFVLLFGGRVLVLVRVIASVRARVRCSSVFCPVFLMIVIVIGTALVLDLVRCSWCCHCSCYVC